MSSENKIIRMGKRGPRSKMTDDRIDRVKELYRDGIAHRSIAKELGISETNIRRIISLHSIPKRERKLATLLSPQQEDALVKFLLSLGPFRGKYRTLRTLMEEFATENGMRCTFTYSWRDGFVRRHRHRLPSHIVKLLSPKVQREDDVDSDLDILDNGGGSRMTLSEDGTTYIKEPSVWKQKPKLSTQERAVKETRKAFVRGGLTREEAHELLVRLRVPGITEQMIPSPAQVSADVVAAALNNIFGETSNEPTSSQQETTPEATTIVVTLNPIPVRTKKAPVNRKTPLKKTPFQLEILDKAFQKSTTCGDKRAKRLARILGLTPAQIIYWFHNTARHKRKLTVQVTDALAQQDGLLQEGDIVETEGDEMLGEGEAVLGAEHEGEAVLGGEHEGEAVLEGTEGDAVEEVEQDQEMPAEPEGETVEA